MRNATFGRDPRMEGHGSGGGGLTYNISHTIKANSHTHTSQHASSGFIYKIWIKDKH